MSELPLAGRTRAELADIVLRSAWDGDPAAARCILHDVPDLCRDSFLLAVVTENIEAVRDHLATDPDAAARRGGPIDWQPLLYLAYARLAPDQSHVIDVARALLDHGADPNAHFADDWGNTFTALTGVIGEGEGDKPPHPQALALATLLIERGADPFDRQALYNTSVTRDDTSWLDFLWDHSQRRGLTERWRAVPSTPEIGGKLPLNALDYLLGNAVAYGHLKRAEWLMNHGAHPDGRHAYSERPLIEEARVHGHSEMADLLRKRL